MQSVRYISRFNSYNYPAPTRVIVPTKSTKKFPNNVPRRSVRVLFAHYSTMHGFKEIFSSKSYFFKIVWLVVVATAIGCASYQLKEFFEDTFDSSSYRKTVIEPLDEDVEYPPLRICYLHWIYWVNWAKASKIGFDKPSVVVGMSFHTNVVSLFPFNVTEALDRFNRTMKKNNFNSYSEFYTNVSYNSPPGISVPKLNWTVWKRFIHPSLGYLCYNAPPKMIRDGLKKLKQDFGMTDDILELNYDVKRVSIARDNVSRIEYDAYARAFVQALMQRNGLDRQFPAIIKHKNLTDFISPPFLNVDNVRINIMMITKETYSSRIQITGTLHKWTNNINNPCNNNATGMERNFCDKLCIWEEFRRRYPQKCMALVGAVTLKEDKLGKVCQWNITFLSSRSTHLGNMTEPPVAQQTTASYNSCIESRCRMPCVEWKFASTASDTLVPKMLSRLGFQNKILIEYPAPVSILVFTEVNSQTWQSIIANTGGILALWLGGSIISLIQIVYLLFVSICQK